MREHLEEHLILTESWTPLGWQAVWQGCPQGGVKPHFWLQALWLGSLPQAMSDEWPHLSRRFVTRVGHGGQGSLPHGEEQECRHPGGRSLAHGSEQKTVECGVEWHRRRQEWPQIRVSAHSFEHPPSGAREKSAGEHTVTGSESAWLGH